MKNRIKDLFETKKENIFSIYFTAGYPTLNDTTKIIQYLEESGVDLIEIGIPFSDPLADGPVIQQSGQKAIENGMTLEVLFEQLKDLRKFAQIPVILMGYINPVMQFGENRFIEKCAEVGVDGIILPDMPLHYFQNNLQSICEENSISNILLITPETSDSRIQEIDRISNSFIYLVSSNSITGNAADLSLQNNYYQKIQTMQLKNPHLIGFGVHNKETFEAVRKYSSGAIIGTAFIKHINEFGVKKETVDLFVKKIRV